MYERVLFIVLILVSAYLLKRKGVFSRDHSRVFIDYVIYFALPLLTFQKVRELEADVTSAGVVLTAWGAVAFALLLASVVGRLTGLSGGSFRAFLLVSSFGNTAFLGYPFAYAFYGDEGLTYAVLYDQLGSFLLVVSAGFLIAVGRLSLREIFLFPPFPALLMGVLARGVSLPEGVEIFLEVGSGSLIPVVLFAVGLRFEPAELKGSLRYALCALVIKMVAVPLGVLAALSLLGLTETGYRVALLEASMPPMVMAGVLAMKYGLDERLALSAITLGIPLSFLTVPLVVYLSP